MICDRIMGIGIGEFNVASTLWHLFHTLTYQYNPPSSQKRVSIPPPSPTNHFCTLPHCNLPHLDPSQRILLLPPFPPRYTLCNPLNQMQSTLTTNNRTHLPYPQLN